MLTLIRNGRLYGPNDMGKCDILIAAGTIIKIAEKIDAPPDLEVETVDAAGKIITPGFIDLHVHITGGGGEGGPATRVPEIRLSRITQAGVTTVLGVLGTDDVTRRPESLLAKAMALEKEGITAYILTGSYHLPPVTITGSVRKDIALIPHVLGVGEVALSDHRSSQPGFADIARLVAEARVGGMIGGKAGLVQFHMGSGQRGLDLLFRLVAETEIPIGQIFPTHSTRTPALLEQCVRFAKMGGNVDITASCTPFDGEIRAGEALRQFRSAGVSIDRITLSSDSNGSMPIFDENGTLTGLTVGDIANLLNEFRRLVTEEDFSVPDVLKCFTLNPARRMGISNRKGSLEEGKDADLVVFDTDWNIDRVYCRGRLMVSGGMAVTKGTFE